MPFITLEGGEGAGKSTQIKLLAQAFEQAGCQTLITREPGGSQGGEAIRGMVVSGAAEEWHPVTESLLFMAARYDHVQKLILPALKQNIWVLCDRFFDSTIVYQGIGKKVEITWLNQLYTLLLGNIAPDQTLLLDINPQHGLARAEKRGNVKESRFEQMDISFHETLRKGFLELAKNEPSRITVIDASATLELIHREIINIVNKRFQLALKPVKQAA